MLGWDGESLGRSFILFKSHTNNFLISYFLKDLDAVEFDSHISDPLFRHSDILFAKYPGLRELLAAEMQQGDNQLKEIPEEATKIEIVPSRIEEVDTKIVETFKGSISEPIMAIPEISRDPEMMKIATHLDKVECLDRSEDKNVALSDFVKKQMAEESKLSTVEHVPKIPESSAKSTSNEREIIKNTMSLVSDNFDVTSPEEMSEKYEQFRKWLADSTDARAEPHMELPSFAEAMGIDDSDVFSDSDEFLDAVEQTNPAVHIPAIPSIQTVPVDSDDHIYETLSNMPLSVSQLSASMASSSSCRSSASDLTVDSSASRQRRAAHNKGQAPAPPSASAFIPFTPQLTHNNTKKETAEPKDITITNAMVGKVPAVIEKEKKFRNFFNYIPNMLKPLSPASSIKNLHIETDI